MRSNNEPSRSQASLARGKACQPRQASQRMSAGPGSKIRALSTPVFSPFRGFFRAWPRCGFVCARPAGVAALWQCISRVRSRGAVRGISLRGTGRVLAASDRGCGVFGWRSRNRLRFIRRPGSLHGVSCRSPSLPGVFLSFAESAPCLLPFEESAVYVGDKFGPWPLDD